MLHPWKCSGLGQMENEGERPVLFKMFIKFLDDGIGCLQKWANRNLMKFIEEMEKPVPGEE